MTAPQQTAEGVVFGLVWPGKQEAAALADVPADKHFVTCPERSVGRDGTRGVTDSDDLCIEGDNLDALRLLRETHRGQVKLIYIDPPYNTGMSFVYDDRYAQGKRAYVRDNGPADDGTAAMQGRFHAAWLSMMLPRLTIARDLLREDGVICISIGEGELHTLMLLCDEIFGEAERITVFSRVTKRSGNNGTQFSPCVDYVLVYAKDARRVPPYQTGLSDEIVARYSKRDEHVRQRGPYQEVSLYQAALKHGGSHYPITCPDGTQAVPPEGRPWRWNEARLLRGLEEGRIVFKRSRRTPLLDPATGRQSAWNIYTKMYLKEREKNGLHPKNFSDAFQNVLAAAELRRLGMRFDFAKPTALIRHFVTLQTTGDDLVLDFFSGSGTTAHAVMQANAADGGHRRWIMVQDAAPIRDGAFPTISALGEERIRRAGAALRETAGAEADLGFTSLRIEDGREAPYD